MRVSRLFYPIAKEELYRSITIHSDFSEFDPEYLETHTTYVRTKLKIQALFSNKANLPLIRRLCVVKLPSEFIEFESYLCNTFFADPANYAHTLNELTIDHPTNLKVLRDLGLDDRLRSLALRINVHTKGGSSSLSGFSHLENLSIGPVKDNNHLRSFISLVSDRKRLSGLRVVKQCKKIKLEDLLQSNANAESLQLENNLVSEFSAFPELRRLSLENITINSATDTTLPIVRPERLEYLSLANVNEISDPENSILAQFSRTGMPRLRKLRLSLRQSMRDSTPALLMSLKANSLEELDLEVRYNVLKEEPLQDLVTKYIIGIQRQSQSLIKLSFSIFTEKSLVNLEEPLSFDQFQSLFLDVKYPKLESLRTQVHFSTLYDTRFQFFHHLPRLEKLWIMGSNAVEKHFGLGNTYPGIFDNWLRIQHLPTSLVDESAGLCHLKYIKIDKCLFRMKPSEAIPRDCIDDWFDQATRVCFHV